MPRKKRKMSDAARARISAGMKARWAKAKAAGKTLLGPRHSKEVKSNAEPKWEYHCTACDDEFTSAGPNVKHCQMCGGVGTLEKKRVEEPSGESIAAVAKRLEQRRKHGERSVPTVSSDPSVGFGAVLETDVAYVTGRVEEFVGQYADDCGVPRTFFIQAVARSLEASKHR